MALSDTWPTGTASSAHIPWIEQFKEGVIHLAQQKTSRLRSCVRAEMVMGNTLNVERVGATAMVAKTTRHTPTPILDVPHSRRKLVMKDFLWADLIDEEDQIRAKINYKGAYTMNAAMAAGRQMDQLIVDAALGNAIDEGGSNVALPAGQQIAVGGDSLTIAKLREAKYIMDQNEIDSEGRYLYHSAEELQSLLSTTEITSSDYNTVKALVQGEVNTFLGFTFKRGELPPVATTTRSCFAFQKDAMVLGVGRDVVTRLDQRQDVSYAWQVFLAMSMQATRVQEEGVVQIDCVVA